MKSLKLFPLLFAFILTSCTSGSNKGMTSGESKKECKDECCKSDSTNKTELSCKLTSPQLQKRKETVLASLKKQVIEKKALENGYSYKFPGDDKMIDKLTEFVKTERECCDFFTFTLAITGDKSAIWLDITGAKDVKDFIKSELEL